MNEKRIEKNDKNDMERLKLTLNRGADFLASLQYDDGCWKGDYGGAVFLLPMYVGACYITGEPLDEGDRAGIIKYFFAIQNGDGSIGLHPEDRGMIFTSALSYVALRILGIDKNDERLARLRGWILGNGTALGSASWGKFFLALLNLCPFEGLNPLLPELWLLPYALPFHPGRMWCHARQVYLPMSYLYGIRGAVPEDPLIRELRSELYDRPYDEIDFTRHRDTIAPTDNYRPFTVLLTFVNRVQILFEKLKLKKLRTRALEEVFDHILYEDRATGYIDIGPVNSILNALVHFFRDPRGDDYRKCFDKLKIYLWEDDLGIKFNGYNSTALWDTAFAIQGLFAAKMTARHREALEKAYGFIRDNQILEDVPDKNRYYRHPSRGGWPFSDREHGWPISDCTAEGYKAARLIEDEFEPDNLIARELMNDSVELILSYQNRDGGWATYENTRGGRWLELLNPSSVFGDIMIDYSHVECTSSCMQALMEARPGADQRLAKRIDRAVRRGAGFIRRTQKRDGGFEGSWAVCFTYGAWFGVWGLSAAGKVPSRAADRACRFLIERQNPDGGWGESSLSCRQGRWIPHETSQTVHTAWALMALIRGGMGDSEAVRRGAAFLMEGQMTNGDWPAESLVGIFNKTTLLNYENYRRYFPLWALGMYLQHLEG